MNDQNYDLWTNLTAAYEWVKDTAQANAARARAITLIGQVIKTNPQDANAQATLAALWAKNGQREKALDAIRISLALSPKSQYVLSQVADAFELLGDRASAIRYLEGAFANGLPMQQPAGDPEIQGVLADPKLKVPVGAASPAQGSSR